MFKSLTVGFLKTIGFIVICSIGAIIGNLIFNGVMYVGSAHPEMSFWFLVLMIVVIGTLCEGWKHYQREVMKAHAKGETLWKDAGEENRGRGWCDPEF